MILSSIIDAKRSHHKLLDVLLEEVADLFLVLFVLRVLALGHGEDHQGLHLGFGGLVAGGLIEGADLVATRDDVLVLGFGGTGVEHLLDCHDDGAHYLAQMVLAIGGAVGLALAGRRHQG